MEENKFNFLSLSFPTDEMPIHIAFTKASLSITTSGYRKKFSLTIHFAITLYCPIHTYKVSFISAKKYRSCSDR